MADILRLVLFLTIIALAIATIWQARRARRAMEQLNEATKSLLASAEQLTKSTERFAEAQQRMATLDFFTGAGNCKNCGTSIEECIFHAFLCCNKCEHPQADDASRALSPTD